MITDLTPSPTLDYFLVINISPAGISFSHISPDLDLLKESYTAPGFVIVTLNRHEAFTIANDHPLTESILHKIRLALARFKAPSKQGT